MAQIFHHSVLLLLVLVLVQAGDPDPLEDFSTNGTVSNSQFVLRKVFQNGVITRGAGGIRAALNTRILPGLQSQGITYVHFLLEPCGINLPHTHPRAAELLTLVSGGPIQAGFVDTMGTAHINVLYPGDITVFPRALLHYELNIGNQPAFFISALNSHNPGTLTSVEALLNLPQRASSAAFNLDIESWQTLKDIGHTSPMLQKAKPNVCTPGRNITPFF